MKIHPVRAELFHADGWRDRHDEANSSFPQFCDAPPKTATFALHNVN